MFTLKNLARKGLKLLPGGNELMWSPAYLFTRQHGVSENFSA